MNQCQMIGRQLLMVGIQGRELPAGYKKCNWISGDGTGKPRLNTGIQADFNAEIRATIKFKLVGAGYASVISHENDKFWYAFHPNHAPGFSYAGWGTGDYRLSDNEFGEPVNIVLSKEGVTINDTSVVKFNNQVSFSGGNVAFIGSYNNPASSDCYFYGAEYWLNGECISKLLPCLREADGVAGAYDVVRGLFISDSRGDGFEYELEGTE